MLNMLYIVVLLVIICNNLTHGKDQQILVFGGNGFLGSATVEKLIEAGDNVTIVNRGNLYWDTHTSIYPHVTHITCDRKYPLKDCAHLVTALSKEKDGYDTVIDFSGYSGFDTKESSAMLHNKVRGIYIFVSTDSVYDVCDKTHDGRTKETDANRPEDEDEVKLRKHYYEYGHGKLEAEESLLAQRVNGGFPFVLLRLPDVIGPRDSTLRFWLYQLWLQLAAVLPEHPVIVPGFLENIQISYVYSEDVADVLVQLMQMGPQIRDQAINLANPETLTLTQFLADMQDALGMDKDTGVVIHPHRDEKQHQYFYPSVRKGPVDVTKAINLLDWKPTPWLTALANSVEFYEKAMREDKYQDQRDEIIQILKAQIYTDDTALLVYGALEKIYEIDLKHFKASHDEL